MEYTRITPNGEEKCSLLNGEGITIKEKTKAIRAYCDGFVGCVGCPIYEKVEGVRFGQENCSYSDVYHTCDVDRNYNILVNAGVIKPPVNFVKANPDDEIDSEGDAVSGLADSGTRRKFDSGAVRDVAEGKGRCDLLPLDVVSALLNDSMLYAVYEFQHEGDKEHLFDALKIFSKNRLWDLATMFLEVAKHFEAGCKKYGERNWEKGIPLHCYIDSGVRHYLKWLRGDTDEPHDRAFCWNILCCIWTCNNLPEMNDLPWSKEDTK